MPELKDRIICVYRAHVPDAQTDHGALSWFARQAHVKPWSVTRWLTGRRRFRGAALSLLERLEAQAATNGNGK
jgi:hypothetical protein